MKCSLATVICFVLLVTGVAIDANAQATAAQAHVAAAKAAVSPRTENPKPYHVFGDLFDGLCAEPSLPDVLRTGPDRSAPQPRANWYQAPAKVFDNLYFIGTRSAGIYAINTSEGIILLDTNFDWNVKELVAGLLQFGLDAANIKYILITHAHDDRYWGAKTLQDLIPTARVVMSEADWNVVEKDNSPARLKPRKDMVATDGQKLTLGDTTITLHITPGHTPGTISLIFPLKYGSERHVGSMWGGTDFGIGRQGVQYYPDGQTFFKTYIASLNRFKAAGDAAGADTIIAQNMGHANNIEKLRELRRIEPDTSPEADALAERLIAGEVVSHPFVSKDDVDRYYTVIRECAQAQLSWRTSQ